MTTAPEGWALPQPMRVTRIRRESADVATFDLIPASPFEFAAGQFNMLYLFGLGEVAISISGDPANTGRIVHTVRAVGAVSGALTQLRRDAVVGVRGPYGLGWPVAEADHAGADWRGNVGVGPALIRHISFDAQHAVALVCGPEIMMRFTAAALCGRGVAAEQIYLSMERHMKCAVGLCGRCQFGPAFICRDGPVFRYDRIASMLAIREI